VTGYADVTGSAEEAVLARQPCRLAQMQTAPPGIKKSSGGLRLLFLAEFLESGIAAQRVPDRVEP
jgi:hypothetical protein